MKRFILIIATTLAVAAFGAAGAGAATAEPYTSGGVTVDNGSPNPGGTTSVTVKGCQPNGTVTVTIGSTQAGTGTADANGEATVSVTVPTGLAPGSTHTVSASCDDPNGEPLTQTAQITISGATATTTAATPTPQASTAAPAKDTLPATGSSSAPLIGLGIGLLAVGALVVVFVRRLRRA